MLLSLDARLLLLVVALLIEATVGYPQAVFRATGHPVSWIGALIAGLDSWLNRSAWPATLRRFAGVLALLVIVLAATMPAFALQLVLRPSWIGLAVLAVIASTLLAARSLDDHVRAVATAMRNGGLEAGRSAVSRIVGRDPEALDAAGVARAAIESLAENFSDGVVAPAFWLAVLGLPGAAAYKAVNTADSMIGHRTPRHEAFGWASARLDDVVNLPASRLSALLIVLAAAVLPDASARGAVRAVWRDAGRHRSPNAGWPEAALAGALDLSLAGPRVYHGHMVEDACMGSGRREATAEDIGRALSLYRTAIAIGALLTLGVAGLIRLV